MSKPSYQRYGNIIIDRSRQLGSGTYGSVFRGYYISQQGQKQQNLLPVAIKQSVYDTQNIKQVTTLQILKHTNIIQYIDYRVHGNRLLMVMQLCQQGTLEDLVMRVMKDFENSAAIVNNNNTISYNKPTYVVAQKYTEKVIEIYSQIVEGVRFMYRKNILHRDLKPSNILLKGNVVKIADFGTSKIKVDQQLKTFVGTPLFCSPQLLEMSLGEEDTYTQKSDIWSLGLILYYMLNYQKSKHNPSDRLKESLPWKGKNTGEVLKNIRNEPLSFKNEFIPENLQMILRKMLTIQVEKRMSFQQFLGLQQFMIKQDKMNSQQKKNFKNTVRQCTVEPVDRKAIDQDLWALIQMETQQTQQSEQIIAFYRLIIQQLQRQEYPNQLIIQLYMHLYKALGKDNEDQRQIISEKFFERRSTFQKFVLTENQLEQNYENDINLLINHLSPSSQLVNECKYYIKKQMQVLERFNSNSNKEQKDGVSLNTVYTIYDLCTLLAFGTSWIAKKRLNFTIAKYQESRNYVKIQVLIERIKSAVKIFKLS